MQTQTRSGQGFTAGVKDYRLTYYMKHYQVHINDLLAAFRVIAQLGIPPEEAAIAAESSTGTWTTVWTNGLTSLDRYKGRCYGIELVSGEENQYIAYIAYPFDLFEEGSVINMLTSIVGNVFGFKVLRCLRLEDLRLPSALLKTFHGAPHGIQVERDKINGRSLLGCTIKPKLGLSAKNYGQAVYEGHYLNATAGTCEEMLKRAQVAKELRVPIRMSSGDHLHSGTVVGKLEGDSARLITRSLFPPNLGFVFRCYASCQQK